MTLPLSYADLREVALALLADPDVQTALRRVLHVEATPMRMTVKGFAAHWRVSPRQVIDLVTRGLPVVRIGRVVRVPVAQADAWVTKMGTSAAPPGVST